MLACGELGAGKTALTQGIGAGLDVEGAVISPTFVLSRVHRSRSGGPTLVHVDAYRLADLAEVEDLDLEASLADSVTVVEWGEGKAEQLADDRLDIVIVRSSDPDRRDAYRDPHRHRAPLGGLADTTSAIDTSAPLRRSMSDTDTGLWLGIDTSTGVTAALARPHQVLASRAVTATNQHAEQLMPLISEVVAESGHTLADLAGIAVGIGPGPFTGLRVGIVTAQTLSYVLDVPLRGVCSLDIVALTFAATHPDRGFTVVSDARRKELYWATYDRRRSTASTARTSRCPERCPPG